MPGRGEPKGVVIKPATPGAQGLTKVPEHFQAPARQLTP